MAQLAPFEEFDPFKDIERLQQRINRLFDELFRAERSLIVGHPTMELAVDIYEEPDAILIEADLPGLTRDEVKVSVEDNVLTIEGERKLEHEDKKENYRRIERSYGLFSRSFTLPWSVDADKVEATFKDGVLRIRLPKREEARPKQIEVKVK
ncbi:MAG: Hsp20/alpha crystallin family protein [Acidobacteria bacterium]|nr:MAG: Hsp20/alpha crystallin family protein [Acidobacteriota bacterium]